MKFLRLAIAAAAVFTLAACASPGPNSFANSPPVVTADTNAAVEDVNTVNGGLVAIVKNAVSTIMSLTQIVTPVVGLFAEPAPPLPPPVIVPTPPPITAPAV